MPLSSVNNTTALATGQPSDSGGPVVSVKATSYTSPHLPRRRTTGTTTAPLLSLPPPPPPPTVAPPLPWPCSTNSCRGRGGYCSQQSATRPRSGWIGRLGPSYWRRPPRSSALRTHARGSAQLSGQTSWVYSSFPESWPVRVCTSCCIMIILPEELMCTFVLISYQSNTLLPRLSMNMEGHYLSYTADYHAMT